MRSAAAAISVSLCLCVQAGPVTTVTYCAFSDDDVMAFVLDTGSDVALQMRVREGFRQQSLSMVEVLHTKHGRSDVYFREGERYVIEPSGDAHRSGEAISSAWGRCRREAG